MGPILCSRGEIGAKRNVRKGDSAARTRRNPSLNDSTTDGRKDNEWVAPVNQLSSLKSITAANSGARKIP